MNTLPTALTSVNRWSPWQLRVQDGKPRKVALLKINAPEWASYEQSVNVPGTSGVGFLLGDGWCGIDFDHVLPLSNAPKGVVLIKEMLDNTGCYKERSYSGDGIHYIGRAPSLGFEVRADLVPWTLKPWGTARFFVMTGRQASGDPTVDISSTVDFYIGQQSPAQPLLPFAGCGRSMTDEEVLGSAVLARNGDKFMRLWHGDLTAHGGDHSAADLALCRMLAFWTNGDEEQTMRLFTLSELYRPTGKSASYLLSTVRKACAA